MGGYVHPSFVTTLLEDILSGRHVRQRAKGEGEGG